MLNGGPAVSKHKGIVSSLVVSKLTSESIEGFHLQRGRSGRFSEDCQKLGNDLEWPTLKKMLLRRRVVLNGSTNNPARHAADIIVVAVEQSNKVLPHSQRLNVIGIVKILN